MIEEIIFKSDSKFFKDEKLGLKNNTVREIDLDDERFQRLLQAWKYEKNISIIINEKDMIHSKQEMATFEKPNKMYSIFRTVKHIAVFKKLIIITWEHSQ